jgi:hypothetical protein
MFKTKKKYKEIKEELSTEVCKIIERSLERYPRKVLFGGQLAKDISNEERNEKKKGKTASEKGKEYEKLFGIYPYETHDPYSKMFYRAFGKFYEKEFKKRVPDNKERDKCRLSPNIYRHIWLSNRKNIDFNGMSYNEKEKICKLLGTSVETAHKMYLKIDFVEKNDDSYDEKADEEKLEECK